jgi:hypothetical protein
VIKRFCVVLAAQRQLVRPMEIVVQRLPAPRVICIGSITCAVAALIAGFVFDERRVHDRRVHVWSTRDAAEFFLLLPFVFMPARCHPHYVFASLGIAAALIIQWQLIAWLV